MGGEHHAAAFSGESRRIRFSASAGPTVWPDDFSTRRPEGKDSSDRILDRRLNAEEDDESLPVEWKALKVGRALTGRRMMRGNRLELLKNGEEAYPAMLEAIGQAKRMVCLSTYIFRGDDTGRAFADALEDAARRGVDVRLIVDGLAA